MGKTFVKYADPECRRDPLELAIFVERLASLCGLGVSVTPMEAVTLHYGPCESSVEGVGDDGYVERVRPGVLIGDNHLIAMFGVRCRLFRKGSDGRWVPFLKKAYPSVRGVVAIAFRGVVGRRVHRVFWELEHGGEEVA